MTCRPDPAGPTPGSAREAHAWHLVLGLGLWITWFCATYGGLAVACAVAPPDAALGPLNVLNAGVLVLAAATTAAFAAGAWLCARAARSLPAGQDFSRRRFVARAATALYGSAAVSTTVVALPAWLLAPCL